MVEPHTEQPWLPDFCRRPRILAMLAMAELVMIVVFLAPDGRSNAGFGQLLSASAFALWMALAVSMLLCVSRRQLSKLPVPLGASLAVLQSGAVALVAAGIVYGLYSTIGNTPVDVGFWRFVLGVAAIVVLITALALRYFYVSDRWIAQLNANARAQADALQARIRPHFLFNSMNLIASLVRRDPEVAERAVLDLSDLFRAALGAGENNSTLEQEVELARRYLAIESLRLGDRMQVAWQIEEPLPWELVLPRLVLQPLVENAVLHGISRLPEGGCIDIRLRTVADHLHLTIRNPAPEPGTDRLPISNGTGHAVANIERRLAYRFGPKAHIDREWAQGSYECSITLPLKAG